MGVFTLSMERAEAWSFLLLCDSVGRGLRAEDRGQDGMFEAHLRACSVGMGLGLWWPGGKKQWPLKDPLFLPVALF